MRKYMKGHVVLQEIENDRELCRDLDSDFFMEYQKALLLALKETGTLNEIQYYDAEQMLKCQSRRETGMKRKQK